MGPDAFARHDLGSAALVIISALHAHRHQTVSELVGPSSVSRATTHRTLQRLADHGFVQHTGETWALAPRYTGGLRFPPPGRGHRSRRSAGSGRSRAPSRRRPRLLPRPRSPS
ncbi:helix-turn-helix domain-containing protein [Streptomyces sp. NL15-2K]|uniref:helix-turn-helix domain-containing protein n=1 Tax=Streptomyces sp. NL15-2K TaxID=376149 RepID=UPI00209BDEA6|nr:helix-turn-helix domain-containing protein [Streptomyces sp. NL15-2K]